MHKPALVIALGLVLASCGQQTVTQANPASDYAARPELQDPQSQAILQQYEGDPGLIQALREAYNEVPRTLSLPAVPALRGLDLASDRLAYIKSVGWGNVPNYDGQYAQQASINLIYPGLFWDRDGCSAPDGLGLGYREEFRPACNVHDFGYRNLKVYQRTSENRETTDDAFYTNMKVICNAKAWYKEPPCYVAAYAYFKAVRIAGASNF